MNILGHSDKEKKQVDKKKQGIRFLLYLLGFLGLLFGGVKFMTYVFCSIIFFWLGKIYKQFRLEYEDYKMLKKVQKSIIKLEDFEAVKKRNDELETMVNKLNTHINNMRMATTNGTGGFNAPCDGGSVPFPQQQTKQTAYSNVDNLRGLGQ